MKGEVLVQELWGQEDSSDITEQEVVMSQSDELWLHHPQCYHWVMAEPGPVCLMPGLCRACVLGLEVKRAVGLSAGLCFGDCWQWLWVPIPTAIICISQACLAQAARAPQSECTAAEVSWERTRPPSWQWSGELPQTDPMSPVDVDPMRHVDVICKQKTAINKSHPLKLAWLKSLFLFLTHKDVGKGILRPYWVMSFQSVGEKSLRCRMRFFILEI